MITDMIGYLEQDRVWINRDGDRVEIASMTDVHRRNAARWLTRNADRIWTACMVAQVRRDIVDYDEYPGPLDLRARDFVQEKEDEFVHVLRMVSKPDEWIKETPLYRRLMEGLTVSPVEYFGAA